MRGSGGILKLAIVLSMLIIASGAFASPITQSQPLLTCADKDHCPENVGLWINVHQNVLNKKLGQCTSWLVAPDRVVTNAHCIPEKYRSFGALFNTGSDGSLIREVLVGQDLTGVIFPATETLPEEFIAAKRILAVAKFEEDLREPDYAIVELSKPTNRKPFEVNRDGIVPGMELKAFTIDFIKDDKSDKKYLKIVQKTCETIHTLGNFKFLGPDSPSFAVNRCDIYEGDSGSPLMNESGEVVGILNSSIYKPPDPLLALARPTGKDRSFQLVSGATNLACVPGFYLNGDSAPISDECTRYSTPEGDGEALVDLIHSDLQGQNRQTEEEIFKQIKIWSDAIFPAFVWQPAYLKVGASITAKFPDIDGNQIWAIPSPKCFNQNPYWLQSFQDPKRPGKYLQWVKVSIPFPFYSLVLGVNNFYQVSMLLPQLVITKEVVEFSPQDMVSQGKSFAYVHIEDPIYGSSLVARGTYSMCKE